MSAGRRERRGKEDEEEGDPGGYKLWRRSKPINRSDYPDSSTDKLYTVMKGDPE